ncbi:magnesium transporter [Sporobacter termitidis DSM 10068]|uniref:Magnesium transporter n=1 Tax=Sporobacter termitidis DSM 10068 TaxID=1123282 RepID=A0A1M5YL83_9FIRM|nr:CorA family divalent cation transporter [Sporobacter termitidis]SHI12762.1 magnesium transporter [Sporobacter termitidis DSM 10068]
MRKILKSNEMAVLQDDVNISRADLLNAERHICLKLGPGKFLLALHYCDIRNAARKDSKVFIYCSPEHLIYLSDNKECAKVAGQIDEGIDTYRQLLEFFVTICTDDLHELEKVEDRITKLEDMLLTRKNRLDNGPDKIIAIRRDLLNVKRYYEQLGFIAGEFAEDENDVLPPDIQARFYSFSRRIDHLLSSVLHLREYITQVREAYQAQLDIQQNQIMKVFTVISGIFMPLTLIVGWYGMNLRMPEYGWSSGYAFVILLSVVVCVGCLAVFRLKKWF